MRRVPERWVWIVPPIIICMLLFRFASSYAAEKDVSGDFHLTILHTNDLHSHDEPFMERGRQLGGLTRLGHMIRTLKKQEPKALIVDAGDMFQGTPLYTKYHGEVEVALLNKIGYDIFTIGNHEFDDGPDNLAEQLKKAQFQIINCNMDCSKVPALQALIKPYVIREVDGQRVAFIGAITPELNSVALRTGGVVLKARGTEWMKPIEETIAAVKSQGVNKIVLVTHIGVELEKQLATLPDVDVIIGGHSHTRLEEPIVVGHPDGTSALVVQTGCFTRALGRLALTFDNEGRVIVPKTNYRLINITSKVLEDPDLKAYVDTMVKPLLPLRTTIVGTAIKAFDNNFRNSPNDSALGDLICDALVEDGKSKGVAISFENRGGIRGRIEPGPISLEKIEEILPFDNRAVFATINGACLLNALEHSVAGGLGGPFLDQHGLKIAYDSQKERGHRIIFAMAEKGGKWQPIDPTGKYRIALNDYSFDGGEGYDFKSASDVERSADRLSVVFRKYLDNHHDVSPDKGERIIAVRDGLLSVEPASPDTGANRGKGKQIYNVKFNAPNQRGTVLFVTGKNLGIASVQDGLTVPVGDPEVAAKIRTTSDGTCNVELSVDKKDKYLTAVFTPTKASGGKASRAKKLVSSPIALPNSATGFKLNIRDERL